MLFIIFKDYCKYCSFSKRLVFFFICLILKENRDCHFMTYDLPTTFCAFRILPYFLFILLYSFIFTNICTFHFRKKRRSKPTYYGVLIRFDLWLNGSKARETAMNSTEHSTTVLRNETWNVSQYECEEPYPNQTQILQSVSWWLDGFLQIIIGCIGFAGNTIAIPVLSHRKLSSIFNKILVFLAGNKYQRLLFY